jgi:hypothetical protein
VREYELAFPDAADGERSRSKTDVRIPFARLARGGYAIELVSSQGVFACGQF